MYKTKEKVHLYLFGLFFTVTLLMKIAFDRETWHTLLLFLLPFCFCFLAWSLKEYSAKMRIFIAVCTSAMTILFWYDFTSLDFYIAIPFLSGALALLISHFINSTLKD